MFTGLVQHVGTVDAVEPVSEGRRLWVAFGGWDHEPATGDSISVSGCCLTVAGTPRQTEHGRAYPFVAVPETLEKTTLGGFSAGTRVNLEHAATASTLLGGHIVQGHVDMPGEVESVVTDAGWRVRVRTPGSLHAYLVPKGSITVDGVSLTIAESGGAEAGGWFEVALIPETLERTTLKSLAPGGRVNLEADVITKTVVHTMTHARHLLDSNTGPESGRPGTDSPDGGG